ncbi:uncharacterized protein LOC117112730 [Anneissia japonica]|uniref:uncharacterized protein LOC117112730 n=1 Tax=Anneissia japonica TaxID=1529436 RepID=UPI0014256D31|nr:uncharacterized protein LOC117112730 [Anneissia japonica]
MALSTDTSTSNDEIEPLIGLFCAMHVVKSKSKVVPFSETSLKKIKECAKLWKSTNKSPQYEVAVEAFETYFKDEEDLGDGSASPSSKPRPSQELAKSVRRKRRGTPGYHRECYRNFCNLTDIKRAINKKRKIQEESTKSSGMEIEGPQIVKPKPN